MRIRAGWLQAVSRYVTFCVVCLLMCSTVSLAQTAAELNAQLEQMKTNYQQWLARMPKQDLLVEYDSLPMALDIPKPRFTWVLDLPGRGRKQTAYQLLVASDKNSIATDKGDIWNTGWVNSDQSSQITYAGLPLQSNKTYYWKVRIRDESGKQQPFSKTAVFNTGLLKAEEWNAEWIGRGDPNEVQSDVNTFLKHTQSKEVLAVVPELRSPLFRREFRVDKKISRARIFVAGLGLYELRLNGAKLGQTVLTPSKTDFRKRVLYDTYDVTTALQNGNNALGIMLGNGWFNGQKKYWGWQYQWYGSPRVILQLMIEYNDGSTATISTDKNWKSSWGPVTFNCLFDGEHYDARLEQKAWDMPGFNDQAWTAANQVRSPGGVLSSAMHEPGMITQIIKPVAITKPRPDTFVFDLGQNITGWVRLKLKGTAGSEIKLKFAERIRPNGMIDPSSANAALQEDHYILRGDGIETFEPHFTYHGFQYVQVTGLSEAPSMETIEGKFVQAAVAPSGSFTSSNDLINRIHLCMVQSQRCNVQMGVPTDDTQRPERQGWGGDALMSAQEAMLNISVQKLYTKWYQDNRDQQDKQGRISCIVPRAGIEEDLVWSSSFVLMPWYQYVFYGDTGVLKDNYTSILKYMNFLASQGRADIKPKEAGENHIFNDSLLPPVQIGYLQQSQWGDHLSLAETFKGRSGLPLSISTAFYYHDLQIMEKMAKVLGKTEEAERFRQIAAKVLQAFNDKFLNRQEGYYDDKSQSAQAWPLFFGMVPPDMEAAVMRTLLNDIIQRRNEHLTTGYVGTKYVLDLLTKKGYKDLVWKLALKTDFPSWAYALRNGRTTITERWTDGGSQNHVVLGAAIDPWFYNILAGIQPDENTPGFRQITIKPYIPENELDWVNASVNTQYGLVSSAWQKKQNGLLLEIKVPVNTTAWVYLPAGSGAVITENGKPVSQVKDIRQVSTADGVQVFEVGSGAYSFSVSDITQRK
jgi:alpha-L-rhamnosidase